MLYGRSAECAAVERLLEDARASRSGVLVVRGEPGLGKSALLADAVERAAGVQVVHGGGIASEFELAFAGLHRLLRPLFELIDRLPQPQASALRRTFGASGDATHDRFLVSIAVLSLVSEAAERGPLLCVVDDAHWLDRPSADALRFCARRLDAEGIGLVIAAGEDAARSFDAPDLPELRLPGLDADAAGRLLRERAGAPVAPRVVERLTAETEGNPLALVELSGVLSGEQLTGREPLPAPLPIGADLERAFLDRVALLAPHSRAALLLVAADDTGDLAVTSRAARATGVDIAMLAPAEAAGLVRIGAGGAEFRHPLLRSAIYGGAGSAERRAVHRALAAVMDDEPHADRRAWHLAAAAVGPDSQVADELEASAERAGRRGGHGAAVAALERAADLSVDDERRARRLTAAADAAWRASLPERAIALLDRASPIARQTRVRADVDHLRGVIAHGCGVPGEGCAILLQVATLLAPTDPVRALEVLLDAGDAASYAGDAGALIEAARRAATLSGSAEVGVRVGLLCGVASLLEGKTTAQLPELRSVVARAASVEDPRWLAWAGLAAALVGDDASEAALYRKAVTRARSSAAVATLTRVLEVFAFAGILEGRYVAVAADASEGLQLSREAGLTNSACHHLATLAWVAAIRGQEAQCRKLAGEVAVVSAGRGLGLQRAIAEWALALLDLGVGRPAQALRRLMRLSAAGPGAGHSFVAICATPDLVESAVRAGRPEDAQAALVRFDRLAGRGAPAWVPPLAARCRALVAADPDRDRQFGRALGLAAESGRAFDRARTELLFGEHLRRTRRRVQAREHLHAALAEFERVGAVPWGERAHRELRASGQAARRRDPSAVNELTAQEIQIARFVATGATNREVAAQLFLSKRTVDYHLRRIFAKLAISARSELMALEFESGLGPRAGVRTSPGR